MLLSINLKIRIFIISEALGSSMFIGAPGTLRKKSESGIFGTHFQKMQNSQIP
jgi:hypothetical protein